MMHVDYQDKATEKRFIKFLRDKPKGIKNCFNRVKDKLSELNHPLELNGIYNTYSDGASFIEPLKDKSGRIRKLYVGSDVWEYYYIRLKGKPICRIMCQYSATSNKLKLSKLEFLIIEVKSKRTQDMHR